MSYFFETNQSKINGALKICSVFLMVVLSSSATAMMCVQEELDKRYEAADYIFEATVQSREKLSKKSGEISPCSIKKQHCGPKIATATVGKIWKGNVDKDTTTIFSIDACYCLGTYLLVGEKYIVFGKKSKNEGYQVHDIGACFTEPYDKHVIKRQLIKKLNNLSEKENR